MDAKPAALSDQTHDLQSPSQVLAMEPALPASLSQGTVVLHDKEISNQLNIHSDSAGRDVGLIRRSGDREERQSIISLPEWNDAHNIRASVHMPTSSREDKITIVLNKTAKPYYTFTDDEDEATPTVVRKDVRALAPPTENHGDLGLRSALRSKAPPQLKPLTPISPQHEGSDGEERVAKRPRMTGNP